MTIFSRILIFSALALLSIPAHSFELSALARANCLIGFNESVTYEVGGEWQMLTESYQFHPICGFRSFESEPDYYGWRAYAGCVTCGDSGWEVDGVHYVTAEGPGGPDSDKAEFLNDHCGGEHMATGNLSSDLCWRTNATDCNIWDW